ncbi:hypothetical protein PA25_12080 [Pseudoalteromonas sp. A25]|uniref:cupin-like domain-containing protein n=1 Tax=Pseudoalteromonas sp. A25 TaxID=116092 RepID=UPI0012613205|nr:cupin-like domain-containing protein [Pseudoalteromonas sp. A25]BBN81223.1 hypothetical protein PA25_12080 [Pseudoalteromonas sp. A25]
MSSLIDVVTDISAVDFKKNYLEARKPLLVKGGCSQWSATKNWSPHFFGSHFGSTKIPLKTFTPNGILKQQKPLKEYCDEIQEFESSTNASRPPYCHDIPIFRMEPRLIKDIENFPVDLLPSAYKRWWAYCQFFLGPAGSVTPLHFDCLLTNNLFFQISGTKRFTLMPHESAEHCGQYNWRWFKLDPENPALDSFPNYLPNKTMTVDVEGGDILFMPSGMLHHVRSLSTCISFNIDFHDLKSALDGVLALNKGIPKKNAYYNALVLCRLATKLPECIFLKFYKSYLNYVS